ncbi:type II secretion system protein [Kiritimatiellota bacterium B12222]|nr:type II secretion system protein [Kiritimatiellota bacterium B12222]
MMKKDERQKQNAGFTLIEMLVVVAIIALLATLMTPVVGSMLEKSKMTSCSNRLKNIHQALIMYGVEHGGLLPSPSGPSESPERRWPYFINPYLDPDWDNRYSLPPQFKCPMVKDYPWLNTHTLGFNYYMGGTSIRNQGSSKTIMLADTRSSFYLFSNRWNSYFHYRHDDPTRKSVGKCSIVYGDGHWSALEYGNKLITTPHEKCSVLNPNIK